MKYICLGYHQESAWHAASEAEITAMMDECFEYDDELRAAGHFTGGEALQMTDTATTIRWDGTKAVVIDGPFAETKEQLGGILILEADDLNHAIQIMSKHPGIRNGCFEIRPAADLTEMVEASRERRKAKA